MNHDLSRLAVYSDLSDLAKEAKANMRPLVDEIMQRLIDTGAPEEALPAGILILITALAEEAVARQLLNPHAGISVSHGSAERLPLPENPRKRRRKKR